MSALLPRRPVRCTLKGFLAARRTAPSAPVTSRTETHPACPAPRRFAVLLLLGACGVQSHTLPTPEELSAFERAGPVTPELDVDSLTRGLKPPGPYRVGAGDLLEIRFPPGLASLSPAQIAADGKYAVRVSAAGTIELPVVAAIEVAGRALPEIERAIADAFHPKYTRARPSVVAGVTEHRTTRVVVLGAVEAPGVHELRSDELTLVGALSRAGGILKETNARVGARAIRVYKAGAKRSAPPLALPVKNLNIPFADVPLQGGETIEVERYEPEVFTVVGLVRSPGAFPYQLEAEYNLMQALAIAGGVEPVADPPYATVFRKDASGKILGVTFEIDGTGLVRASDTLIKPGDVIAVQQTMGTWTRQLLAQVLRFNFGLVYTPVLNDR